MSRPVTMEVMGGPVPMPRALTREDIMAYPIVAEPAMRPIVDAARAQLCGEAAADGLLVPCLRVASAHGKMDHAFRSLEMIAKGIPAPAPRTCCYCKVEELDGHELRPYGPEGAPVCYPCGWSPEHEAETKRHMDAVIEKASRSGGIIIGGADGPVGVGS